MRTEEDGVSEERNEGESEEGEMNRRIRGHQYFDVGHGALVFTFSTAGGIAPSLIFLPLSII